MHTIIQFCNDVALEEQVILCGTHNGRIQNQIIRLSAMKFGLRKDAVICISGTNGNYELREDKSNICIFADGENEAERNKLNVTKCLKLITGNAEEIYLKVYNMESRLMQLYSTPDRTSVLIGEGVKQTIGYIGSVEKTQTNVIIEKTGAGSIIRIKNDSGCYINKNYVKAMNVSALYYGDEIISNEIRLIWLEEYVLIEKLVVGNTSYCNGIIVIHLDEVSPKKLLLNNQLCNRTEYVFSPSIRNIIIPDNSEIELLGPPVKQELKRTSLLTTIGPSITMALPMSAGSLMYILSARTIITGNSSLFMYTGIVTAIVSALIGTIWAIVNLRQNRKNQFEENLKKDIAYKKYIHDHDAIIKKRYRMNKNILLKNFPSIYEISRALNETYIWNKKPTDPDCFSIRLGTGKQQFMVDIKIPGERFEVTYDELRQLPAVLKKKYRYLNDVPICINLREDRINGFISKDTSKLTELMRSCALQLASMVSPDFLKIVFLFMDDSYADSILMFKWLMHVRGKDEHFVCCNEEQIIETVQELNRIIISPEYEKKHFLILTDSPHLISKSLFDFPNIYIQIFSDVYENIPDISSNIIQNDDSFRGIIELNGSGERTEVDFDHVSKELCMSQIMRLCRLNVKSDYGLSPIPDKVTLPELYNVDFFSKEIVYINWSENDTENSIRAPIGIAEDSRIIYLDLHEKAHGPHGLFAGMTGSGKSEILSTMILSLSIRYSPEEIGFFLIDYKGGGMANLFSELPHLMGSISNLSGNTIHRAMVSIRSENERRQRLFLSSKVNSITEYHKQYKLNRVLEPLPHIMIIIDEFAELKREEPDFMKELISVAQVGRSLGIHLILATQKPSGSVDDNIFSNSKFRICLRVQDKQDSKDMLHRDDAAFISNPGRAFLQVGQDELFEAFQSGYAMEKYREGNSTPKIFLLNSRGRKTELLSVDSLESVSENDDERTHFSEILKILNNCNDEYFNFYIRSLWLPPLDNLIILSNGRPAGLTDDYDIVIGRYDEPKNQYQGNFILNIIKSGHICICGNAGSGKSTFLQTMLCSMVLFSNPSKINIYIIDYSNGLLRCFADSLLTGGYITDEVSGRINNLFCMIKEIMAERKERYNGVSFEQYRRSCNMDPLIQIVIDSYGSFREHTGYKYDQIVDELLKYGETYGVFLVITGFSIGSNDVPSRVFEYCKTGIALALNDKYQYSDSLRVARIPIYPREEVKGRGLAGINGEILEFQTGVYARENDIDRIEWIAGCIEMMNRTYGDLVAARVPYIPDNPTLPLYMKEISIHKLKDGSIPIGYEAESAKTLYLERKMLRRFIIAGRRGSGKTNLYLHIKHFVNLSGSPLYEADSLEQIIDISNKTYGDIFIFVGNLHMAFEEFYKNGYTKEKEEKIKQLISEDINIHLICVVKTEDYSSLNLRGLFEDIKDTSNGIYMGGSLDSQSMFDFSYIPYSEQCRKKARNTGTIPQKSNEWYAGDVIVPVYKEMEEK